MVLANGALPEVEFGELDAATMDCVVSKARRLVHRPAVQAAVQALGCSHTVSFDKGAVRWAGMTLPDLDAP